MQTHEFVSAVQKSARIDSHEHAEHAVKATLSVLGERLPSESRHLAAQLPSELAEALGTSEEIEKFGLEEFYRRVAEREGEGCQPNEARQHARAVTAAIREAVGPEYDDVVAQLPDDWGDLLHTENVVH